VAVRAELYCYFCGHGLGEVSYRPLPVVPHWSNCGSAYATVGREAPVWDESDHRSAHAAAGSSSSSVRARGDPHPRASHAEARELTSRPRKPRPLVPAWMSADRLGSQSARLVVVSRARPLRSIASRFALTDRHRDPLARRARTHEKRSRDTRASARTPVSTHIRRACRDARRPNAGRRRVRSSGAGPISSRAGETSRSATSSSRRSPRS
jgi:hypothetical protein